MALAGVKGVVESLWPMRPTAQKVMAKEQIQERERWWSGKVDGSTGVYLPGHLFNWSFQIDGLLSVVSQAAFNHHVTSLMGQPRKFSCFRRCQQHRGSESSECNGIKSWKLFVCGGAAEASRKQTRSAR